MEKYSREKIFEMLMKLRRQREKLNYMIARVSEREKALFDLVVKLHESGDRSRAVLYANELAETRKMLRILHSTKLNLEKTAMRIETALHLLDTAETIPEIARVSMDLKRGLLRDSPNIFFELDNVSTTLNNAIIEASIPLSPREYTPVSSGEEVEKILREALIIAEERRKSGLPSLSREREAGEKTIKP